MNKKRELFLLVLVLLLSFSLRMAYLHEPMDRDEGMYAYIGQEILAGKVVYKDAVDIKHLLHLRGGGAALR